MYNEPPNRHNVLSLSIDYDGCLGLTTENEAEALENAFLIKLEEIIKRKNPDQIIVFIGSNRQSAKIEYWNAIKQNSYHGSAFFTISNIAKKLLQRLRIKPVYFSKILLADLFLPQAQRKTTYDLFAECFPQNTVPDQLQSHAILQTLLSAKNKEETLSSAKVKGYLFEEGKTMLHYFQMQHLADYYPNSIISHYFFDDKTNILRYLHDFYKSHLELIPKNVRFYRYKCVRWIVKELWGFPLEGTGEFNPNYRENLREISNRYFAQGKHSIELSESSPLLKLSQL